MLSDLLLGHGKYGTTFTSEDSKDLSAKIVDLLSHPDERLKKAKLGKEYAQSFDWDVVAEKIFDVYEMAMAGGRKVTLASENRSWNKFLGRE